MTAERDREIAEMLLADGLIDEAGTSLEWAAGKLSFDAEHRAFSLGLKDGSFIPPYVWELDALEQVGLQFPADHELSPEIAKLHKLRELVIYDGNVSRIPEELGRLPLTHPIISGNNLEILPSGLGNLPENMHLDLRGNPLQEPFASNLVLVCSTHHRMIHEGALAVQMQPGEEPACERVEFIDQRDHVISRFPATSANLEELEHWLREADVHIDPALTQPKWDGRPMDLQDSLTWMLMGPDLRLRGGAA